MRVENQNIGSVGSTGSFGAVPSGIGSRSGASTLDAQSPDTVQLSGASSLINLSKSVSSADRQSRIAALTAQVRSGSYQSDARDISRAMISDLTAN